MHACILTDKQRLHRREREIKQVSNLVFYALSAITVNSGRCEREREREGGREKGRGGIYEGNGINNSQYNTFVHPAYRAYSAAKQNTNSVFKTPC